MPLAVDGILHQINIAGNVFRVRYYTETLGSVWDDERTLAGSGVNIYISGIFKSIDSTQGSEDQILLEQGRIKYGDSIFYVNGSVQTTSGTRVFTIANSGISANERVYREITQGVNMPQYFGVNVMKKVYVREIPLGSLF